MKCDRVNGDEQDGSKDVVVVLLLLVVVVGKVGSGAGAVGAEA